jgi:glycosyltransferase involved in cell wall biosynthesis
LIRAKVSALQKAGRPVELGQYLIKAEAEQVIVRNDWLLIPSRIESIPVVFSDAMKLSRPVIAMPVGDLPILVDNKTGVLAEEVSAVAYSRALQQAIRCSPAEFESGIAACASQFQLDILVQTIIQEIVSHE